MMGLFAMPKIKVLKRPILQYPEEKMTEAVAAVRNGMSKKEASRTFAVPRSTLIRKLSGTIPEERRMGPARTLTAAEENLLAQWVLSLAMKGFPITRHLLCNAVKRVLDVDKRPNPFTNNLPGMTWFHAFMKRNPVISEKHAESLTRSRASVTKKSIEKWFQEVELTLTADGFRDVLNHPRRIFNADESGFLLCPKSGKVLGPRGRGDFYHQVPNNEKEQLTVMGCFSASGETVPPMVIFPYKRLPRDVADSVPDSWAIGLSESGWMNSEVFFEYISNHFMQFLKNENIPRPVVMFVDGHRSHLTPHVSDFCSSNDIVLVALHPNSTHLLQPADVSVFKPLKDGWKDVVRQWKFDNYPKDVTRKTFCPLLQSVFATKATEEVIKNGFLRTGLYPFNCQNVNFDKCIQSRELINPLEEEQKEEASVSQTKTFIEMLEEKINPVTLATFKEVRDGEQWSGKESAKDLFHLWRDCRIGEVVNSIGNESLEQQTPASETSPTRPTPASSTALLPGPSQVTPNSPNLVHLVHLHPIPQRKGVLLAAPLKDASFIQRPQKKKWPNIDRYSLRLSPPESGSSISFCQKRKKKNMPKNKRKLIEDPNDWLCKKCGKSLNDEKLKKLKRTWVECDKCKDTYHFKCIPKSHVNAFGLDEEDMEEDCVTFLCHNCATLSEDEDSFSD
ncbi:hypothetical protein ANN_05582 [Periplaneta americana]|uniref:HTH CENPB-type domain-containing protein n=1 Tax=Periplaneta americana TaxID=6978 RepID=A0ABQ8TB77_PERAM|nr:hypothetical protein ANN_05582 [Periplaneta americana]